MQVKVVCFDRHLQVLILKDFAPGWVAEKITHR